MLNTRSYVEWTYSVFISFLVSTSLTGLKLGRALYLTYRYSIPQGMQPVRTVESDTFHAQRLLILLTVQLQRLQVQVTAFLVSANRVRPQVCLFKKCLTGAAEGTVGNGLLFLKRRPADGTSFAVLETSLQTLPTETVGAG